MKMTGASMILKMLEKNGVSVIFGYPGAANCPIYDKLKDFSIKHILVRSEQGAAHMANGYAHVTGKVGVCTATSGPGATNLVTGIATAYMDSVPMVAITGQVVTSLIGKDAFQEVDITGATLPFCKHNYLVKNGTDLPRIIDEAFFIASTGRPGPVLIDIPMDLSLTEYDFDYDFENPPIPSIKGYKPVLKANYDSIQSVVSAIKEAKRPVIMAGGGITLSNSSDELRKFIDDTNIPVISTMTGIGTLDTEHKRFYGMMGSHGLRVANYALNKADLLVIMGARIGDRAVANAHGIQNRTKIVHIDIDPAEIGKNMAVDISLTSDVGFVLERLNQYSSEIQATDEWINDLERVRAKTVAEDVCDCEFVNPKYFINRLSEKVDSDMYVTTEVGQNQIWAANCFKIKKAGTFITSAGFGTMGYGLPAAIGAKVASPKSTVIAVMGDGSFQMDMCELGTMKQWDVKVKMVLFRNNRLGMVREHQANLYKSNYCGTFLDGSPDFEKIVSAYGFKAMSISENSKVDEAIDTMLADEESFLLILETDPLEKCQIGYSREEHETNE